MGFNASSSECEDEGEQAEKQRDACQNWGCEGRGVGETELKFTIREGKIKCLSSHIESFVSGSEQSEYATSGELADRVGQIQTDQIRVFRSPRGIVRALQIISLILENSKRKPKKTL